MGRKPIKKLILCTFAFALIASNTSSFSQDVEEIVVKGKVLYSDQVTALKTPVRITRADHKPAPLQTIPCDFSHSPGVAKITGTATTIANDTMIRRTTNNGRIPTTLLFLFFNFNVKEHCILQFLFFLNLE